MPDNPRIKLPFGDALDRESGLMVMRPGSMEDLRNVVLHEGSAVVRAGFGSELELTDDEGVAVSHVVQGHALRSDRIGIVVSYQQSTERVFVHRIDPDGTIPEYMGEWVNDQDGGWGDEPPVISMAESYGKVFMAHDERFITRRAPTIYYENGETHALENEFTPVTESDGDFHKTRFRGVVRWLNYLVGWGYGTNLEDRPELVRVSFPGDPTSFDQNHWIIIGNRRDPVLRCIPCGDRLGVLKDAEGYPMVGTSRADFGAAPAPVDPRFGLVVGALAVNYGGMVMAWSDEGPRLWDFQGASRDVAMPLDLRGPQPATLVAQGETKYAFACYIPTERIVAFVFGRRVYAFSVRNEESPKWAGYWELDREAYCAFTLYTGSQISAVPRGHPEWDSAEAAGTYVYLTVKNLDFDGDETLEIWIREDGGDWPTSPTLSVPVSPTSPQLVRVPVTGGNLTPGTAYNVAMRHRRGVLYGGWYQSANPSDWNPVSQGDFTTTINPPVPVSATWARTAADAEQITVVCTPTPGFEDNDIDIYRDDVYLDTIAGPGVGNNASYVDTTVVGETWHSYQFMTMQADPDPDSPLSTALGCWVGPAAMPVIQWAQMDSGNKYSAYWNEGSETLATEVHDNYNDAGGTGVYQLRQTLNAGEHNIESPALVNLPVAPGIQISLISRHKQIQFAVTDYGPFQPDGLPNEKLLYVYAS